MRGDDSGEEAIVKPTDLSKQDCLIIAEALQVRADRIRNHAHDCAVAAGNWNDPEAKRWRDEARALDKLAGKFI
jgi:hypothetical protein